MALIYIAKIQKTVLNISQNHLVNQVDDYKQKGKTITKFFYDHLEEQLSQTLKELKEEKDPNFTFFPEYFIREDIERNFPPLY